MPAPIFPTQHTWAVLEDATAANLNSNVRDATNFHNGGPNGKPLLSIHQTVVQSIPNATTPQLPINLDFTDLDNAGGHSTADNSRYVCQLGGWYQANATLVFSPATSGIIQISLGRNGTIIVGSPQEAIFLGTGFNTSVRTSTLVHMNTGDYLQVLAYQSSGGGTEHSRDGF